MKKLILIIPLFIAGCDTTNIQGPNWKATNTRFLWSTESFTASMATNGTATIQATASNPDEESIKTLAGVITTLGSKAP